VKPKRYVPDLQEMAAQCEANYLRLMRLVPHEEDERVFVIRGEGHSARIRLRVEEDHRYTSMLSISQEGLNPAWLQPLVMQVRMYHDANMAEVTGYQEQKRFDGRYQYPNPEMRLPDEKAQLNRFLAEWLEHCLRYGYAQPVITVQEGQITVR
tara:strand:+ start:490 stop:948 length:459 start_codon:yes stop_codon:yes gene_type:complete